MPTQITNYAIAETLSRLATLMSIAGENAFRVRAIGKGADVVRHHAEPLRPIAHDEQALTSIPGIGTGIAALIAEIVDTGTTQAIANLQDRAPEGLVEIVDIPGIGGKTALKLFQLAGIRDFESLQHALSMNVIANTPGLGPKLADKLAEGVDSLSRKTGRMRLGVSLPIARDLIDKIRTGLEAGDRLELAGSIRRWEETTGDINLVTTADQTRVATAIEALFNVSIVEIDGSILRAAHDSGLRILVLCASVSDFGRKWIEFTGPAEHVALLGSLDNRPGASEEEVYASLDLPWIAPEFRQGLDEVVRAARGDLNDVITIDDVRGELHCHTVWSDGQGTVEEMALAARERGYQFLGISDHSHSLGIANGLTRERLLAQAEEIAETSKRLSMPLLRSSEVEVHRDGSLDFDTETLNDLDVVIASTHSGLTRPRAELMARLDAALAGGRVDILAHPSGRLIEAREPGDLDWPAVFQMARDRGVALEINADPARLDLKADHARQAIEAGCLLTINCDAHHPRGFESLEYGVAVARKGFVPRDRVINTWDLERLRAWLQSPESRGGR